jgi:WD40 repeat protein
MKIKITGILAVLLFMQACSSSQPTPPLSTDTPPSPPTVIVVVTNTPDLPPASATPEPAQGNGTILYDDGNDILSIDVNTGESTVLISREALESSLAKDRSADSYTYGAKQPIKISLSPDRSKALVTICSDLDARYRCLFSDHVYSLDTQSGIQLPIPPDAYGVYWQWSPDGSKLAGAAWSYDRAVYFPTAFYAVNNDGTNLSALGPVINERWQLTWQPDGTAVYPFSFVANFQSIFLDKTKPQDITLTGLDVNESIECLAFSPDGRKAVFTVRNASQKNRERVYIANFDFSEVTQLTEYDIDSRYFCNVNWSPDQRFVHLRYEYDTRAETGEEKTGTEPRKDKLVNVETSSLLDTPRDLLTCGWTPDNNLVYETKTKDGGIQVLSPAINSPVAISAEIQSAVLHCPLEWLNEP